MELFSLAFTIFVVLALAAYYAVGAMIGRGQWIVLLVASLAFYCIAGGVQALGFVLFSSLVTWAAARYLGSCDVRCKAERKACTDRAEKKLVKARFLRRKRVTLVAALVLCLLVLGYVKYWNVILFNFGLAQSPRSLGILLPLGISFFTFQSLGYLIDAYNGRFSPQENFAKYLLFVSWFPQLIQGPINKYEQTGEELVRSRRIQDVDCRRATLRLGYGIFKKVAIANLLFPTYDSIFSGVNVHTPGNVIVLGIVVYSVYMYADFSGGIDIVEGVSELFGIQMAQNFRQPYFSVSLSDFWRRWHMSLGAWMRDYLFYPFALLAPLQRFGKWATRHLGRHAGRTLPACIANIVVFLCVGLWHGAEWHYVLWGLYNGVIVALADLLAPAFSWCADKLHVDRGSRGFHVFAVVRTFLVVQVGRYFDCITNVTALGICLHNTLFSFNSTPLSTALAARGIQRVSTLGFPKLTILACVLVFVVSLRYEMGHDVRDDLLAARLPLRLLVYGVCLAIVTLAFPMTVTNGGGFLYANF